VLVHVLFKSLARILSLNPSGFDRRLGPGDFPCVGTNQYPFEKR